MRFLETVSRRMLLSVLLAAVMTASMLVLPVMGTGAADGTGTVRVAQISDLTDFNIYNLGTNSVWKTQVFQFMHEGLAEIDIDNELYPSLALGWSFDETTLTVDVDLRQGVQFHDGVEMTADDVVYSYLMAREGTTYCDAIIYPFDSSNDGRVDPAEFSAAVQKTGDYSVRFVMAQPWSQFFPRTLSVPILPKHIWDDPVNGFTDTYDRVVVTVSDELMTVGTGPFLYSEGVPDEFRALDRFGAYWGAGVTTPSGYDLYPPDVERIEFVVTGSMDAALLALRDGRVDYIAAAIPAASLSMIDTCPGISVEFLPDSGCFYLAFNEKKEPFGSLAFRRAVSHLIDKERIVDVYMGGLGVEGSSAVPPYFGGWHNDAVTEYVYDDPADPTTTVPEDILDAAGFLDVDGDGWRDLPDGSPMDELVILAPPADYDPVRIRCAEAIAANLVEVGVHASAVAIDFNTLVSKLTAFDYQMLTLGWSFFGYSEAVSVLFDVYGPYAASNTWGFWSEANENPWYSSLWDVSTLADAETQALVDQFYELETAARSTFLVNEQIDCVWQGQEIIAQAVPCNVLYYRVNAMAYGGSWAGWVPHMGSLLNMFSMSELVGGADELLYEDASTGVNVGLSVQRTAATGRDLVGHVLVIDDLGEPVAGAEVAVSFEALGPDPMIVQISPAAGTTDADGVFAFGLASWSEGSGVLSVAASSGTCSDEDSALVSFSGTVPSTIALQAQASPSAVRAGEPSTITLTVTDQYGQPVEGAVVTVDEALLSPGEVYPATVATDASGHATMTYSAAQLYDPAGHDLERVLLSASKEGYRFSGSAYVELMVYNDAAPDWKLVSIESVSTTALGPAEPSAAITVLLTDAGGAPLADETLTVSYSDPALVDAPVTEVTTGADGLAQVGVTMLDAGSSCALRVTVDVGSAANAMPETVTFTYLDPEDPPAAPMFGGYADYTTPKFVGAMGSVDLTFHVFDAYGSPADGITGSVVLASTDHGQLTDWSGSEHNTLWDYGGIGIVTAADGLDIMSEGAYSAPEYIAMWVWDDATGDWVDLDIHGVDIVGGVYAMTVEGIDVARLDQLMDVYLCPDSTADFDWSTFNHMITGQTAISSTYGYGRSYEVVAASHLVPEPVMTAYSPPVPYDTSAVAISVADQDGAPVEGCAVTVYQSSGRLTDYGVLESSPYYWRVTPSYTGADGTVGLTLLAAQSSGVATQSTDRANMYVAPYVEGALPLMSQSYVFIHPQTAVTAGVPVLTPALAGSMVEVQASVTTAYGEPVAGMAVRMSAGVDCTVQSESVTDALGTARFLIDTSKVVGSEGGFVPVSLSSAGPGFAYSAAQLMVPLKNPRPVVTITEPYDGEVLNDDTAVIRGYATDSNGIQSVAMYVDGAGPYWVPGNPGDPYWTFELTVPGLAEGEHTVAVTAIDALGVSGSALRGFSVANGVELVKYAGDPALSTVYTSFRPETDGLWSASVDNDGLKGVEIEVYDMSSGLPVKVADMKVSLGRYPTGTVAVEGTVPMTGGTLYMLAFTPLGPEGGSATVTWTYSPAP